jgi:hypothetical protein
MVDHESPNAMKPVNVTRDPNGWEVRHEGSTGEVRVAHYTDWHRVERALRSIEVDRMSAPTRDGDAISRR